MKINNIEYIKKNCSIPIIINDKLELLKYCDGIHLGQEDLRNISKNIFNNLDYTSVFKILRKKYPDKIVGLSTHNELEILDANEYDLDYIGLGSYRKTNTKNNVSIIKDNASYLAKISKHIVCLIGGVRLNDKVKNINYNVIGSNLLENN